MACWFFFFRRVRGRQFNTSYPSFFVFHVVLLLLLSPCELSVAMSVPSEKVEKPFQSQKEALQHVARQAATGGELTKCGSLACQHDSFRKNLDGSNIVYFAEYKEKSKKKNKKSSSGYVLVPSDSIFFPEGGGQPCDRGTIVICGEDGSSSETKLQVTNAQNVNGVCVLTCHSTRGDVDSSELYRALATAAHVKQELDWDRRFDFMTQHSSQHLISAEAFNLFEMETNSFSLQLEGASYLDLIVNPEVDLKDHVKSIRRVEDAVNKRIRENLPMVPIWLDPNDEEYQRKVRSRLLPDGLTGKIRLIEIDNGSIDCNTCCGTHVPTLGHLQMIKFFKITRMKSNVMRVSFAAGKRLSDLVQEITESQEQITSALSCNPHDHVSRVEQLLNDKRLREKEIKSLNEKLCSLQAKEIFQECKANNGVAVVELGSSADMNFMNLLSATVLDQMDNAKPVLLLLVQCEEESGTFMLTGTMAEKVESYGKLVAQALGGRGGGKNGKFQGKGTTIKSGLPEAKRLLMASSP